VTVNRPRGDTPEGARLQPRTAARRGWSTTCLILGAVEIVAGFALTLVRIDGGTISQDNGLCASGIGQFAQVFSGSVRQDCGEIGLADHAIGWLLGIGAASIAAGIWLQRTPRRPAL
jgi:hypothetical protein